MSLPCPEKVCNSDNALFNWGFGLRSAVRRAQSFPLLFVRSVSPYILTPRELVERRRDIGDGVDVSFVLGNSDLNRFDCFFCPPMAGTPAGLRELSRRSIYICQRQALLSLQSKVGTFETSSLPLIKSGNNASLNSAKYLFWIPVNTL